jgi:acetyl esterase/lipase
MPLHSSKRSRTAGSRCGASNTGGSGTREAVGRARSQTSRTVRTFCAKLAPRYALDLNRVIASGHSAGGEFALWLAARPKIPRASPLFAADPLVVHAVLGLAPAPDLEGLHTAGVCGNVINRLMSGSPADFPDRYAAASPMQLAPIPVPQVLVIGAHDRTWAPIGRSYLARARAVGDTTVTAMEALDSGHFDLLAPTTTTWSVVVGALKQLVARIPK